jgi:hypothetical protein
MTIGLVGISILVVVLGSIQLLFNLHINDEIDTLYKKFKRLDDVKD